MTNLTELRQAIDLLTEIEAVGNLGPIIDNAIKVVVDAAKEHLAEEYRLIYEPNAGRLTPSFNETAIALLEKGLSIKSPEEGEIVILSNISNSIKDSVDIVKRITGHDNVTHVTYPDGITCVVLKF